MPGDPGVDHSDRLALAASERPHRLKAQWVTACCRAVGWGLVARLALFRWPEGTGRCRLREEGRIDGRWYDGCGRGNGQQWDARDQCGGQAA
ncbi:putative uncharacterized protein [Mycolicibacterium fortuitum subsp. acetamidolyticum]|uniref:Uncharacterized protein n=1 Tax=Mycolicibacterium fortuitum subsp. acetamidolyticum TaxID=144550 RepID=A0A117IGD5_MYCFO|nr:hypothetical protein MFTT_15730 [Mycolicibacterium fortuitum subsp. fortuitum]GAT05635.1 putative uncharacterized protein [Mycolicibacterium fortuitum subsp. acetamidolyticum]